MEIRRLSVGDEAVVERLATREPQTALLADPGSIFLAAFDGDDPIGFLLAYEYPRRHGDPRAVLVYELETAEQHRRRGVASALFDELERLTKSRGVREAWVLTEPENVAANALYASRGGVRSEATQWDFTFAAD